MTDNQANNRQEALTQRINELAAKAKTPQGLTKEEEKERFTLRKEFVENFKEAFKSQIEMVKVIDKDGKEVTPEKIKKIQREKGLRDD